LLLESLGGIHLPQPIVRSERNWFFGEM